jgi:hypothetical protein
VQTILAAITERQRSREQYAAAKAVDTVSATGHRHPGKKCMQDLFCDWQSVATRDPNGPMLAG